MESTTDVPTSNLPSPEPKPNLALAVIAGVVAAIIGGIAWAAVTVTTEYQIGYMAIGVGFLVGFAVRLGHGRTPAFGLIGAVLALAGCLLGNFLSMVGFVTKSENLDYLKTLSAIDYAKVPDLMRSTFDVMDLVFYAIAVYEGYRFSIKQPAAPSAPAPAPTSGTGQ